MALNQFVAGSNPVGPAILTEEKMGKTLVHDLVPKHELLTAEEADSLIEKFNISRAQLPNILLSDPAIKGLDAKVGDVIKITRSNQVTGTGRAYRIVIS